MRHFIGGFFLGYAIGLMGIRIRARPTPKPAKEDK